MGKGRIRKITALKGLERPLTLPSPTCISCIVDHLDYILNCIAHFQDDKKGEVEIVFTGR